MARFCLLLMWIPWLLACTEDGLVEGGDVCNAATPGFGQPCGTCDVFRCDASGTLTCQAPASPRQDVQLPLSPAIQRLDLADLTATVRSDLTDTVLPLTIDGQMLTGCLPGLAEPATIQLEVEVQTGAVPVGVQRARLEVTPGELLMPDAMDLDLYDSDADGAIDALEVQTRADAAERPTDFFDVIADLWAAPLNRFPAAGVLFDGGRMLAVDMGVTDVGDLITPQAFTFDIDWRFTLDRLELPCFPRVIAPHLRRQQVVLLCDDPTPQMVLVQYDVLATLSIVAQVDLPADFVPLDARVSDARDMLWVGGAVGQTGRVIPISLDERALGTPLAFDAPVRQLQTTADRLVVGAGAEVILFDVTGLPIPIATLPMPAAVVSLAVSRDEVWVGLRDMASVQVAPLLDAGFGTVTSVELPAPATDLAADPGRGHWMFVNTGVSLLRVLAATRAIEWRQDTVGEAPDVESTVGVRASAGGVLLGMAGVSGWGLLGQSADALALEQDAVASTLPEGPARLVGFISSAEARGPASGHEDDRIEDVVDIEPGTESLLLLRPTDWWVRTILTRLDGEMPTETLFQWSEVGGNNTPQALHLAAEQPHRVGISAVDEDIPSASAYLLDRLPLIDAAAVPDAEPNATPAQASAVEGLPAIVRGELDPTDAATLSITTLGGSVDGIEDLIRLDDRRAGAALLVFDADADLDLYLLTADGEVRARSANTNAGAAETIVMPRSDETLYLGVTRFDGLMGPPTPYTLHLAPL